MSAAVSPGTIIYMVGMGVVGLVAGQIFNWMVVCYTRLGRLDAALTAAVEAAAEAEAEAAAAEHALQWRYAVQSAFCSASIRPRPIRQMQPLTPLMDVRSELPNCYIEK